MINHVKTKAGAEFVYDDQTLKITNGIIRANFVILIAEKTLRVSTNKTTGSQYDSVDYSYSSEFFRNINMCAVASVTSDAPASALLADVFARISAGQKLSAEITKLLRAKYLKVVDLR